MAKTITLVVLVSGSGSNLQAIIDAIAQGRLNAIIKAVISNKADAYALKRASDAHIPTVILENNKFPDRARYDAALASLIQNYQPDLVILAGFMRILSTAFVNQFQEKILNIHPALLPNFPGLNTHQRVLAARMQEHGVSIHFVNQALDAGPIIAQAKLKVSADDTAESLQKRVLVLEHQLYPLVIQWFAENRLQLKNEAVFFDNQKIPSHGVEVNLNFLD